MVEWSMGADAARRRNGPRQGGGELRRQLRRSRRGDRAAHTAYGNLLVGPTAEDQEERRIATVETATLRDLAAAGIRMLPALADVAVTTAYAGLRPATQFKDYQIQALAAPHWISVDRIR